MGRWPRAEIEAAFTRYQEMGLKAARSGDWRYWGDMFTDDVTYDEHQLGRWGGRDAVVRNMAAVMHMTGDDVDMDDPAVQLDHHINMPWLLCNQYPCEDFVVDEDRGWVWALIWNRMDDPGDGSIHQANCFNLFKYAGHGRFSFEQDLYNPMEFQDMMAGWVEARKRCGDGVARSERHATRRSAARDAMGVSDQSAEAARSVELGGGGWEHEAEAGHDVPVRSAFDKIELQAAYDAYIEALNRSARSADWSYLVERFMPDATLIETVLGRFAKREAIEREIGAFLHQTDPYPWVFLNRFVPEAQVIDVERGWVWAKLMGRFDNPGDGSRHEAEIFVQLKYKQDGLFKYAETIYNPNEFKAAMKSWRRAKAAHQPIAAKEAEMLAEREERARQQAPLQLGERE